MGIPNLYLDNAIKGHNAGKRAFPISGIVIPKEYRNDEIAIKSYTLGYNAGVRLTKNHRESIAAFRKSRAEKG